MPKRWSAKANQILVDTYDQIPVQEIQKRILEETGESRSIEAIYTHAKRLKLDGHDGIPLADAAHLLGIHPSTIHKWVRRFRIKTFGHIRQSYMTLESFEKLQAMFDIPAHWIPTREVVKRLNITRTTVLQLHKRGVLVGRMDHRSEMRWDPESVEAYYWLLKRTIPLAEVAKRVHLSPGRLGQLTRSGRLPAVKVGNHLRVELAEVERFKREYLA